MRIHESTSIALALVAALSTAAGCDGDGGGGAGLTLDLRTGERFLHVGRCPGVRRRVFSHDPLLAWT